MSMQNKNLFALLGNDVEDEDVVVLPPKEIVKQTTSSKKADVPPPSADKTRAKARPQATGNEGALKNKNQNRGKSAPSATTRTKSKDPKDRQSRTGKTDSSKQVKKGWGDDKKELEEESAAVEDAVEEAAAEEAEPAVPSIPKKSLNDYFAELAIKQQEIAGKASVRQANEGSEAKFSDEVIVKQEEIFVASSAAKKVKTKELKKKQFLEFDAQFSDEVAPKPRGTFNARGRGQAQPRRGGRKPTGAKAAPKPVIDDQNFPSL